MHGWVSLRRAATTAANAQTSSTASCRSRNPAAAATATPAGRTVPSPAGKEERDDGDDAPDRDRGDDYREIRQVGRVQGEREQVERDTPESVVDVYRPRKRQTCPAPSTLGSGSRPSRARSRSATRPKTAGCRTPYKAIFGRVPGDVNDERLVETWVEAALAYARQRGIGRGKG